MLAHTVKRRSVAQRVCRPAGQPFEAGDNKQQPEQSSPRQISNLPPLDELKLPSIGYIRPAPRPGGTESPHDRAPRQGHDPFALSGSMSLGGGASCQDDYGICHKGKIVRLRQNDSSGPGGGLGSALRTAGTTDLTKGGDVAYNSAWMPSLTMAIEDFEEQTKKALDAMNEFLAKLPKGSPIIEVGSRNGDVAVALAKRFPDLIVQPTEGTGQTSQSLFSVLEERVRMETVRKPKRNSSAGGNQGGPAGHTGKSPRTPANKTVSQAAPIKLLQPRLFDPSQESSFTTSVGRVGLGALVAIHMLHYLSKEMVHNILAGCKRSLRNGGFILFCGPFFEGGEVSYKSMLYHSSLQDFEQKLTQRDRHRKPVWGLHDLNWIRSIADDLGLEYVTTKRVGIHDPDDCLLLVLRKTLDFDSRRMAKLSYAIRRGRDGLPC
eukprot:TRINITY_DN24272_c0_g1_i2.p1 TRINITY_DN24272_c0_g1~~TRINITY_DN24272_c0_g1_i2.p1  ORF type:complete len:434 (+),score=67.91 TRINITY_DN24272_c0_g1_i2:175-1476(+)